MTIDMLSAATDSLNLLDGATCEFMGGGLVVVRQQDDTKERTGLVSMTAAAFAAGLLAEKDGEVDGVSFKLLGGGFVIFSQFDEDAQDYSDVELHEDDLRKVLAVLEG